MTPADTLATLYAYRVAMHDARERGDRLPIPPALSADALVDAYGEAMHRGATYMPFRVWLQAQQEPQPPRRFAVVGRW